MHPLVVLNVVGLTPSLIGPHTPNIARFAARGGTRPLATVTPAVTCSVQATFLTGLLPSRPRRSRRTAGYSATSWRSGFGGNRTAFSPASASGTRASAGTRRFTCANLFWWYAMASAADFVVTPRPIYKADGRKLPDCYAQPARDPRRAQCEPRYLSTVRVLGPGDVDPLKPLDRGCRHPRHAHAQPDTEPRLPAASRLRAAAARTRRSSDRQGSRTRSTPSSAISSRRRRPWAGAW